MPQFDDTYSENKLNTLHRQEEEHLIQSLAPTYGYKYIDLKTKPINPSALSVISEETARDANIVAYDLLRKNLSVAIRNPNNPKTQAVLEDLKKQRYQLEIRMCSTSSLEYAWRRYEDTKQTTAVKKGVLDIDLNRLRQTAEAINTPEDVTTTLENISDHNNAQRISQTIETLFAGGIALDASDIHIEPEEGAIRIRYRLDGVLHDITDVDRTLYNRMMSRLKLLSGMILNVKNEAQDGRFTLDLAEKEIEVRSSVIPGASGESIVMRLLDPSAAGFNIDQLGLNDRMYEVMMEQLKRPNGMVITTGPTGSGKTTALYAFLRHTHTPEVKIITIENPVEYKLDDIVQTQTSEDYTFASGLRAVLRQDPDIIMVGEIRDREVAETAVHAAQTGHLVFSTLHTNSAVGGFPRLLDLGVDSRILGSALNIMIGQRLVRKLCPECKTPHTLTEKEIALIHQLLDAHPQRPAIPEPLTIYEAVGCKTCNHTGYQGRHAIYEAILMDEAVEEAVIRDPREQVILEAAKPQKIPTMAQDGMEKVVNGLTSLAELERVVELSLDQTDTTRADGDNLDEAFAEHVV